MLRFELEDAVLDPETKTEEGAAFGKANVAPAYDPVSPGTLADNERNNFKVAGIQVRSDDPMSVEAASLVNRSPFFEPFDKGQSHTYHILKTNTDGKPRFPSPKPRLRHDGAKAALDSSKK